MDMDMVVEEVEGLVVIAQTWTWGLWDSFEDEREVVDREVSIILIICTL